MPYGKLSEKLMILPRLAKKTIALFFVATLILNALTNRLSSQQSQLGSDLWNLAPVGAKIRGFDIPLTNAQGKRTGRLRGSEAVILDRFNVKVTDLTYTSDGEDSPEIYLQLSDGLYNRDKEELSSQGSVYLKRDNLEVSGVGLTWDLRTRQGSITKGVRVVIIPRGNTPPSIAMQDLP